MGFGIDGNDYGINRQEWRQLKKDLKAEAKKGNIDLKRADVKELKKAIKTGNLSAHLDQVGKDMQGIMGLHLTGKVDGTEAVARAQTISEITEIINNVKLDGVDTNKVLRYIQNANIERVQNHTNEAIAGITELNIADFFSSDKLFGELNKLSGIS